jgi:murein DD-endopeptidase MepM/ murein hydrolase activator NlpD
MSLFYRPDHLKTILRPTLSKIITMLALFAVLLSACRPSAPAPSLPQAQTPALPESVVDPAALPSPTPFYSSRPRYAPGELVDYIAQTGDTLPNLAVRFNTSEAEIRAANSFIPQDVTSMPPGMPMKIPIYYLPLWGSPYQIIPDSLFVNGPAQVGFDTVEFVNSRSGWLKGVSDYVSDANRSGAEIIDLVARNYSVSPRLLLALLEYNSGALSEPVPTSSDEEFPVGFRRWDRKGLFLQLAYAANLLNNNYYLFRTNRLTEIELKDGRLERIDPWQNAASASLHVYFNGLYDYERYAHAISPDGLAATYRLLFGDPWQTPAHIPGSLVQPAFLLPFEPGDVWALTGGPHTGWGAGEPLAALDFAPPSKTAGCVATDRWATAVADGVVVRSEEGQVMLDLDGDGDERTGWNVFYLHLGTVGRSPLGAQLKQGQRIGHPSCEGGEATGTHLHIAHKYNGEWLPAEGWGGVLAFNLEGWTPHNGSQIYLGTLSRHAQVVTACTCSNAASWVKSDRIPLRTPTPDGLATPLPETSQ